MKSIMVFILTFGLVGNSAGAEFPLRVVSENLPPFNYMDKDKVLRGPSTKVVQALLKTVGVEPKIEMMEWDRAFHVAENIPNVIIFSILRTKAREKKFHWLGRITPVDHHIYAMPGNKLQLLERIEDIKTELIGVPRSSSQVEFLLSHPNMSQRNLLLGPSYEQLYKMQQIGRIDLFLAPSLLVKYLHAKLQTEKKKRPISIYVIPYAHQPDVYVAMSLKTSPEIVDKFKNGFQIMNNSGEVQRIVDQFTIKLTEQY